MHKVPSSLPCQQVTRIFLSLMVNSLTCILRLSRRRSACYSTRGSYWPQEDHHNRWYHLGYRINFASRCSCKYHAIPYPSLEALKCRSLSEPWDACRWACHFWFICWYLERYRSRISIRDYGPRNPRKNGFPSTMVCS